MIILESGEDFDNIRERKALDTALIPPYMQLYARIKTTDINKQINNPKLLKTIIQTITITINISLPPTLLFSICPKSKYGLFNRVFNHRHTTSTNATCLAAAYCRYWKRLQVHSFSVC